MGIDLSPESVERARSRLRDIGASERLDAQVGSAYEPPAGPFDLIALTDVLEHLENPRACLATLRDRLAPGGLLVISTPNRRSLSGARRWLAENGMPGIRLNLAPVDNWQTWTDLESHAASAGLAPRVAPRDLLPPRRAHRLADRAALPLLGPSPGGAGAVADAAGPLRLLHLPGVPGHRVTGRRAR